MEEFMLMRATPTPARPVVNQTTDVETLIRNKLLEAGFILANRDETQLRGVKFIIVGRDSSAFKQPVDVMMGSLRSARQSFDGFLKSRDAKRRAFSVYFMSEDAPVNRLAEVIGTIAERLGGCSRTADRVLVAKLDSTEEYVFMTPECFMERLRSPVPFRRIVEAQVVSAGPQYLMATVNGALYKILRHEALGDVSTVWNSRNGFSTLKGKRIRFLADQSTFIGTAARLAS